MNTNTADAGSAAVNGQPEARQLRRSGDDKMLAGVAGGIARYLHADVTLVRVILAALALFTGAGAALYMAAWRLFFDGKPSSHITRLGQAIKYCMGEKKEQELIHFSGSRLAASVRSVTLRRAAATPARF
jgi:phage shock protein PspC (stress-responsive transcriptional regulator)